MKKLLSLTLLMGILTVFGLSGMNDTSIPLIQKRINYFLDYNPGTDNVRSYISRFKALNDLLDEIIKAVEKNNFAEIDLEVIKKLQDKRLEMLEFVNRQEIRDIKHFLRKNTQEKLPQPRITKQPIQEASRPPSTFNEAFIALKNDPSKKNLSTFESFKSWLFYRIQHQLKTPANADFNFTIRIAELNDILNSIDTAIKNKIPITNNSETFEPQETIDRLKNILELVQQEAKAREKYLTQFRNLKK